MKLRQVFASFLVATLIAGCSGGNESESDSAEPSLEEDDPAKFAGALEGMRGTRPVAVADAWRNSLDSFWVGQGNEPLKGYQYAAEAYDSVVITALAAIVAQTDGNALADEIVGLTRDGTVCRSFEECRELLRTGTDIDYDGKSGKFTMNGRGEVVETNYSIVEFGSDNRIDTSKTKYEELNGSWNYVPYDEPRTTRLGDGILKIGTILPLTGQLATYGPPQFAGVEFAIDEINRLGGVLGKPIEYVQGDSGDTSSNKAVKTVETMLAENVDVLIGPSSTTVTINVIETVMAAGIVQISPANTNMQLVNFSDGGLYFRAAPADDQQTYLLADLMVRDGVRKVFIAAVDDLYGNSIANQLQKQLVVWGLADITVELYNPATSSFDTLVENMALSESDAIVVIGFDESARILRQMVRKDIGPKNKSVYGVDANMGDALGENFDVSA